MPLVALVCFLLAQDSDEMFAVGEKALAKAKELYQKKEYFDSIAEAERARNVFQALAELHDSKGRKADTQKCEDLVKQCNQLIKLANDGRKGTASPKDPPLKEDKPKPPPPPPTPEPPKKIEEPKSDPNLPPLSIETFGKFLLGEIQTTDAEKIAPMLTGLQSLAKSPGPWQSLGRVAWMIVIRCMDGVWTLAPEDKPVLKDYVEKFLTKLDHRGAALHFAKACESLESTPMRWRLLRMIAAAHVSEALKQADSPLKLELLTKGKSLDFVATDKDQWITKEGESIEAVKADKEGKIIDLWKAAPKVREPIRDAYKAFSMFESLTKCNASNAKELLAECKSACGAGEPSATKALSAIKGILDAKKLCKWCEGTHNRRCMNGCDEQGQKVATCNKCSGLGYMMIRGYKIDCQQGPPPGKKWEKGHTCKWPCPKCEGKSTVTCKDCPGPWTGAGLLEGVTTVACECCRGSGWLIDDVKLPCYLCFGTGKKYLGLIRK
jgi:hypothetical protein